jgi:hypothetical protein
MRDYDELAHEYGDSNCKHCGSNLVAVTTTHEINEVYKDHDIAHGATVPKEKVHNGWLHEPFSVDPSDLHSHKPEPIDEDLTPEEHNRLLGEMGEHHRIDDEFEKITKNLNIGQQFKGL